jgi:hypothetical protein
LTQMLCFLLNAEVRVNAIKENINSVIIMSLSSWNQCIVDSIFNRCPAWIN